VLAAKEIQKMYDTFEINAQEQELFDSAFSTYIAKEQVDPARLTQLNTFVNNIENTYHTDKSGEFARLWPEFGELLWPQNQH